MELRGRTVLLTGATGGLGQAIARRLHREGASLVLTGRRAEVLEPLAAETGGIAVACDLGDREAVARLAADHAGVDVLVANAALPSSGLLEDFTTEQLDRALEVNLRAPMELTRSLLPGWQARGSGHAVLIGSISGKVANAGSSVYSATKFGLRGFAAGLRDEHHGTGVGFSVVNPGFVREAGMFADADVALPKGVSTVSPEQVADAVLTAITDDRGDIDVAPVTLRLGAKLTALAPDTMASLSRRLGSRAIAEELAGKQAHRR